MPALQPVVTTNEEIQGIATFVDGAGTAFAAFALTSGRAIKVYKVVGLVATPLDDAIPPANSGAYSVALQGSGADLVLTATGHTFVEKPRPNVLWQCRYPGVVTRLTGDLYHAPGAFSGTATVPPASGPSAAEIADAVRARFITDVGGDTLRHGFGPLIKAATMESIVAAFKSEGDPVVYAGVRNMIYGVLKDNGLIK